MAKPPKDQDASNRPAPKIPTRKPRKGKTHADAVTKGMPKATAQPFNAVQVEPTVNTGIQKVTAQALSQEAAKTAGLWSDTPTNQPDFAADTQVSRAESAANEAPVDASSQTAADNEPAGSIVARARERMRRAPERSTGSEASASHAYDTSRSTADRFMSSVRAIPLPKLRKPENLRDYLPKWSWVDAWAATLTPTFNALAHIRIVAVLCIAIIAISAFTPGFTTIPPLDRDESRFSQATRQMVATGDYVDIRFQSGPRYQKPIGIYWLQSIAVNLYGAEDGQAPIWVYRTVSFVGAVAAALLVYWLALAFGAPPVAFAAGALVALTILLGAEARLAKTDAMLFATILVAQGVLARAFLGKRDSSVKPWHAGVFWTATAAGILIKGPILPLVVGSTALAASLIDRRTKWLRRLRPGLGFMWMLILVLPWFIAIGLTSAGEFYEQSIGRDLLEKIGTSRERPFVPPGIFTFGFFPSLGWPMAPLAFLAIPFAIASWHDKSTRFLVAWIVPTLLVFELSATKLPHYILPIYPALAILAARMVVYEKIPKGWLAGIAKGIFLLIPVAAVIGIPIILFVYGDSVSPLGTFLALVGLVAIIGAFFLLMRSHARASLMLTIVGTLFIYTGTFGYHVPAARTIWITPQLVATLDSVQCENPQLATLGYNEPSLVLQTRTDLRILATTQAASEFLAEEGCRAVFIDAPFVDEVFTQLAAIDPDGAVPSVRLISRVEGLNINGGDILNMHVYAAGE